MHPSSDDVLLQVTLCHAPVLLLCLLNVRFDLCQLGLMLALLLLQRLLSSCESPLHALACAPHVLHGTRLESHGVFDKLYELVTGRLKVLQVCCGLGVHVCEKCHAELELLHTKLFLCNRGAMGLAW